MNLDPNIALQGRQPNVLNALIRASQAAGATNEVRHQNALRGLYREQGPGIVAGEQNALNALSRLNPQASLGVQNNRLGMDSTRQQMRVRDEQLQLARASAARAAQSHSLKLSEVERQRALQEEAKTSQEAIAQAGMFTNRGDIASANRALVTAGLPEIQSADDLPFVAISVEGAIEGLQAAQGPGPDHGIIGGTHFFDKSNPGAGAQEIPGAPKQQRDRRIVSGPDGNQYYADTGERVLPNVDAPKAAPSAKEQQIERLVGTGLNRFTATAIADGRYGLSPLGEVIDKATGNVVGQQAIDAAPPESDAASALSFPRARDAFTVTGGVANIVNQGGDALGMGRIDPEASETRTDIKNTNTQAMLLLSNNFPGRPSNLTRERIEQMLPQPGAFAGPDTSRDKADAVRDMLDVAIRGYQEIINDPRGYSSQQRSEARRWLSQYEELRNQYSALGQSLGGAGNTTSTVIQWSIEE